jgi:hypothetical protein
LFIKGIKFCPDDMKSAYTGIENKGLEMRNMFDRRPAAFIDIMAHLFDCRFSDEDKIVEIQVNSEFSQDEAT